MARMNKIGKTATKIEVDGNGMQHVQYHKTRVVSFDAHNVTLRHGGYMTKTTKTRMNQTANQFNLPFNVYQEKGNWFVKVLDVVTPFHESGVHNIIIR